MSSKRVLTYLKNKQEIFLAPFGQCVVSNFVKKDSKQNEVELHCDLASQGLILSQKEDNKSKDTVILRCPPFCPMLHLSQELKEKFKTEPPYSGISVAVAVILESSDTKVLLTRRPPHMRTFPNVWVPPGILN